MASLSKFLPFGSSKERNNDTAKIISSKESHEEEMQDAASQKRFGKALRKDFLFDEKFLNLNHGSFGTYPRQVRDALRRYQDMVELRPDDFVRYQLPKLLDRSREALATLLHAPVDTIVIIPNASTGINVVLRNLRFEEGDVMFYFSFAYGACAKAILYIEESTPAQAREIDLTYPVSDAQLLKTFREAIENERSAGRNPKIALFDTVCSMPGVRMPYEELTRACKELGVMSLVDGAHGVGHLDLNLSELDFDFFVSNCHKWLFTPRACAVFYVPERNQKLMRTSLPTSHGFVPPPREGLQILNPFDTSTKSEFVYNFEFVGTLDTSAYLTVPDALAYRESLGGEAAIRSYQKNLTRQASKRFAEILSTEVMENEEGTLGNCAMSNVKLPLEKEEIKKLVKSKGYELAEYDLGKYVRDWLTMQFVERHDTFLALTVLYGGAWWVRLSATVYLDMDDFEWAAKVVDQECTRVKKGDFLEWMTTKL